MWRMDEPLTNPRWERYCQERAAGKSQRQAMLAAYPKRISWSENAIDCAASKLEGNAKVKQRLGALMEAAAKAATITRAEIINGMAATFRAAERANERAISQVGVQAVSSIGRALLEAIPPKRAVRAPAPSWPTSGCCWRLRTCPCTASSPGTWAATRGCRAAA